MRIDLFGVIVILLWVIVKIRQRKFMTLKVVGVTLVGIFAVTAVAGSGHGEWLLKFFNASPHDPTIIHIAPRR